MWGRLEVVFLVSVLVTVTRVEGYYFEENFSHVYKYQAVSDMLGMHNVTTVVQFQVQPVNTSLSVTPLNVLHINSFVQFTEQGYYQENPKRWDLSKAFLFQVLPSGLVDLIHVHREDEDEVVMIKKVLASTFSANVQVDFEGNTVSYKSQEMDHTGVLTHDYHVERTAAGMVVRRRHSSNDNVIRHHEKDLHYHPDGTLHHFSAIDTVTLSGPPNTITRKPLHGEHVIRETLSGEFPDITSKSMTQMDLLHKSRNQQQPDDIMSHDFLQDRLLVKKKPSEPIRIIDAQSNITTLVQCVASFKDKHHPNRTECVHQLRRILSQLQDEDLREVGQEALQRRCSEGQNQCQDEKHLFLDIIARIGSATSQQLISRYVLAHPNATQQEVERTLVHCIAIAHPELVTLQSVEKLCFGHNDSLHGVQELEQTQRKACLAIGSLVKSSKEGKHSEYSEKLVEKLENWLKIHNESESGPILQRSKRDVLDTDEPQEHHIVSKMVLLHSIGNAGLPRSLSHLTSYMEPNVGTSQWRRAAIYGLRHYTCQHSSKALLLSSIHDDNDNIREEAYKMFQKHPQKGNLTTEHYNIVLSQSYTYPTLMRMKRGVINDILKKISFRLKLPGLEWQKVVGTSKIGASFGITVRNGMQLQLRTQSGFFKVDIDDEAFAEAHVGLLHINVDLFRAKLCFRGHIKYELNILKEYGINDVEDVIHIFDRVLDRLVNPIRQGISDFKNIVTMFKQKGPSGLIGDLVETVRSLPSIMKEILPKVTAFLQKILHINGLSWVEDIKHLVARVRAMVHDVQQDVMVFYHSVVDAVTVTLPHVGRKLWGAINKVVEAIKHVLRSPLKTFSTISSQITRIKEALKEGIQAKNQIAESAFFAKGTTPYWMVMKNDIVSIYNETKAIVKSIMEHFKNANSTAAAFFIPEDREKRLQEWYLMKNLTQELWDIIGPLNMIKDIASPFIRLFKDIVNAIKSTKTAYESIKHAIDVGMSQIKKIFGKKFHRDFPTEKRPETPQCGPGVFPTTSGGQFKTKGLDLLLQSGSKVVNPMSGTVTVRGDNEVLIQPSDSGFYGYEIIVANVAPTPEIIEASTEGGMEMASGQVLGHAIHSRCTPNSIHVAVRKRDRDSSNDYDDGDDDDVGYIYLDPLVYLERLLPRPHWVQECNDYKFTHIGQVFDSHSAAEKAKDIAHKYKRGMMKRMKKFQDQEFDPEPPYRPQNFRHDHEQSFVEDFKRNVKAAKLMINDFFTSGFKSGSKSHRTLGKILSLLQGSSNDTKSDVLLAIVSEFNKAKKKVDLMPAGAYTVPQLQNLLSQFGVDSKNGDRLSLMERVRKLPGLVCSGMRDIVSSGLGHVCVPDPDCYGLKCSIELNVKGFQASTEMGLRYDGCSGQFHITAGSETSIAKDQTIDIEVKWTEGFLKPAATLHVVTHQTSTHLHLNVTANICLKGRFHICSPVIGILSGVKIEKPVGNCTNSSSAVTYDVSIIDEETKSMNLDDLIDIATDLNMNQTELLDISDSLRSSILSMLDRESDAKSGTEGKFREEIPSASTDICCRGNIPIPPIDITFFDLHNIFMVGPVPLSLGFGAGGSLGLNLRVGVCFLSLSTESTITPWVGAKVWGSLAVDIGFARGGIKLIGYLMDVQFPVTAKITFSQFPVAVTSSMDVVLIPLRLQLQAYAELFLLFTTVTVYKGNLWSYQMQAIRKNIFTVTNKKATGSKPAITAPTSASRNKRSGASNGEGGCLVQQIAHRNPHNPAFQLEVFARNDFSPVKTFYAIGDHPGGNNVADWTEMSEYSVFIPVMLPGGIPLHWTVKVNNSEGLESLTSCTLETYDSTVPDGRFDPSYPFTSRKDTLKGTVIIMDDSPIVEKGHVAIGYGPGTLGSQVMSWKGLNLTKTHERPNDGTILKFFTVPQIGKLTKPSFKSIITKDSQECAQRCIKTGRKCLSFDYETATSICDMNDVIEGGGVERHRSGSYNHYERLGTTYMTFVDFNPSALHHGTPYYINVDIENKLGYTNTLPSAPIIPDFTPPEPGPVGNVSQDVTVPAGCRAAINQRCVDVIDTPNHRKIIDGPGASTVFNGHQAGIDQWYTLSTAHVSANWNGFQDKESGIWGYTWALGTSPCASDVVPFSEPLNNMGAVSRLQTTSFASELSLSDGPYFVTVQALNNVVLGGAMVTSVCHSWPLIVDTTPPEFNGVDSFRYDEDFDTLTIFYMAEDSLSLIAKVDFGLGRTKQDSTVRAYVTYPPLEGSWAGDSKEEATNGSVKRQKTKTMTMMMVVVENLDLTSGVTAWIRLRVNNNVGLYTSGHGDVPLLRDDTPPNPGTVSDGGDIEKEAGFQSDTSQLCANWAHFTDEETGIARYKWGAGSEAGLEDIVSFRELSHGTKQACAPVAGSVLQHNTTYYSTVIAFNNALNSQSVSATSNGVLVDLTPPTTSWAKDGSATGSSASPASPADVDFISDPSKVSCHWEAFDDPESGIDHYEVIMFVDGTLVKSTRVSNLSSPNFEDDTVSLKCGSKTSFKILGYDQAGLSNVTSTDGFLLDCTPPKLKSIRASEKGLRYQATNDRLDLTLDFEDTESGMLEYRVEVFEEYQSLKQHFWPALGNEVYHTVKLNGISDAPVSISVKNVTMKIGATYKAEVVALNRAGLSTRVNSDGVLIDMTEPILKNIHIGLDEEEEVSDDGSVIVDDPKHLAVSWVSRDPESGITRALVAIGTSPHEHEAGFGSVTHGFVEARSATRRSGGIFSIMFDDVSLNVTAETGAMYYVSVVTYNGAGLASKTAVSRPITVLEANVPGVLYDGVSMLSDTDFSKDTTTVSFSFAGFRSKACNIVSYEWGVGTQPFFSNMRPYSSHGLSMDNSTVGHGQAHLQLRSGQRYYVTVRALTGPRCRDKYILSTSNGLTIDASQPTLDIVDCTSGPLTCFVDSPYFVKDVDALNFVWRSQDQETEVEADFWFCGSLPATDDVRAKTSTNATYIAKSTFKDIQQSGRTIFISVGAVDSAGNEEVYTSNSITIDDTKPEVKDFVCSKAVSEFQTTIKCQWSAIEDAESLLGLTTMAVGTSSNGHDLLQPTPIFAEQKQWEFNLADHFDSGSLDPRRASTLYITLTATNVVSLSKVLSRSVTVDTTPPQVDSVNILTVATGVLTQEGANKTQDTDGVQCQDTDHYLEISMEGIHDNQSPIEKVVVVVSSSEQRDYLKMLTLTEVTPTVIISDLHVPDGTTLSASVTVSNSAGLFTQITRSVVVSVDPQLTVQDGGSLYRNLDFQSDLSTLQAHWTMTGHCAVVLTEWSVIDTDGKVVRDFKPVTSEGLVSGDEFSLENGHTYINIIRVTDTLNRTLTSRSDGVTVMIQPPDPGQVRDGLVGEDSDYQLSSTELSANWDTFGNRSLEPSPNQRITRYEVAVGTSVGDSKGRHNVHHFVHAGLNTSYTFTGLNLTTKEVTYYITVRGYSEAGSFTESSSDGIRVGYSSRITRGQVEHAAVQASTDQIDVSWKGFLSDIGMKRYVVGVSDGVPGTHHHHHNLYNYHSSSNKNSSSNSNNSSNSSGSSSGGSSSGGSSSSGRTSVTPSSPSPVECSEIYANRNMFNVRLPVNVGLDTFVALTGLTLRHSGRYYVTVVAEDITGHCALVTGSPITVDTTPPEKVTPRAAVPAAAVVEPEKGSAPASVSGANTVIVNGVNGPTSVVYATNTDRLQVTWSGSFRDAESGISKYQVELLAMADIMSECRVGVGGSGGTGEEGGASGPSSVERQEWEKENAAAEHHGNRWTSNKEDHVKDVIIEEMTLSANVTEANFYHLDLTHTAFYYIRVTASNGAGLDSSISSVPIKVDTTPPVVGAVKSGDDWATDQTFAASTSLMSGMFALAADQRSYDCPQDRSVVGSDGKLVDLWRPLDGDRDRNQDYSASAVSVDRDGIRLTIRYDDSLVRLLKGGILSDLSALQVGNYTSVLQALAGQKMVTSMALTPDMAIGPQSFEPPQDDQFSLYEEEHWDQTSNLGQKYSQQKNNDSSSSSSSSSSSGSNNNKSSSSNVKASQNSRQLTTEATTTVVTTKQQGTVSSAPNVTQQRDPRIFGMGYDILGYKVPESVPSSAATTWYCLFWVTDKNGDKREWVDLDFDPTASENEYIIAVTQEEDDRVTRGRTFGAKFYVNGQEKAAYSGLSFESPVHTYAYVRNIDGYKPTVTGPFDSFSADAVLADFRVPVQTKKLCKYGSAFFDGDSGIHEIWLGLSDERTAEVSPVMPYKLHSRFCKPCMSSCSIGCDRKCSAAEFQGKGFDVVHFNLTGLNLIRSEFNATTNDSLQNPGSPGQLKSSSMSYYYLQVKAVNFAGQETVGLSKGTMVDLTPPLFQAVTCVDPSYSMDEPSDYQGTTESVGAYWECEEDVGEIIDYTLGVGTRPGKADVFMEGGKDLRIKGQRDLRTKRALAGLDRLLRTNQTYYVVVIATNNAGLQSNMSCNITVDTEPPSVVGVVPKTAGAYRSFSTGEPASLLEDSSRIEINWAGGPKEVAFYEWQIGTTTGQSDIFPRIKIGTGQSNKVSLVNGQLYMDGASANQSMSISMMARRNWTNQDSVQQSKAQSSTFHMEPGRCLHYGLYAVSKSHMAAPIQVPATCITRKTDVIDDFDFSQIRSLNLNAGKKSANNDSHEVKMVMEGVDGRVMAGLLSSNDLQTGFGSAASTSFKPFIQDPLASRGHTTRFLRNRIQDFLDTSFYLSPAPVARLTKPLRVDLTFDPHKYFGDNRPMLVFWDTDSQKWGSVDENCDGGKHIDMEAGTFTAKICPYHSLPEDRNMNPKRSRRSAGPSFQSTQYALVSASPYANTPPVIVTNEIVAREDHSLTVDIQCQDKENDAVFLMITKPPTKGQALIVNDTFLSYKPYKDAYGTDSLVLKVKEQNTKLFSSLESSKTITVRIKGDNDSPVVLYVQTNGQEMRVNSKQNITVPLEGNSRNYYLGNIILTDVDYNETFYWKILPTDLLPSFFQLTKEPVSPRNSLLEEVRQAKTTANYSVSLTLPRNMTGRFGFRFVASDHKTMTTSITQILALDLWVFTNPCVHGRCDVNPNFKVPCNSKSRISSFDQFQCKCDEGYKGERCTQAQQSASKVSAAEIVAYCLAATLGVVLLAIVLYFCLRSKFVHNKVSAVRRFSESLERQTGQIVECLTVSQPKPQMITSGHPKVVNVSSNTTTADSVAKGTNDQRLVGRLVTLLDGGSLLTIGGGEEEVEEETVVMSREDEREENRVGRGREGGGSGGGVITVNEGHGQMSDSGQPGQNLSLLQRSDTELTKVSM